MGVQDPSSNRYSVTIAKDRLSCTLTIGPAPNGPAPTELEIMAELEDAGISQAAVDHDAIAELIKAADAQPAGEHTGVVGTGKPAKNGRHAGFHLLPELVERFEEIKRRREILKEDPTAFEHAEASGSDDGEAVDFRNQSAFVIVSEGDQLGTIEPQTNGEDGIDVCGQAVAAKRGRSLDLKTDSTTQEVGNSVVAACDGHLLYKIDKLTIESTLTVKEDISYTTGNIDFPGPVVIHGGVKDHFIVRSAGDLRVDELVEAASLITGASLSLGRGMTGREIGTFQVGGDLQAGYLDGVIGTVEGVCTVNNEIKESKLDVWRGVASPSCVFYGGELVARQQVELGVVGSTGGIETALRVGVVPEMTELVTRLGEMLAAIDKTKEMSAAELGTLSQIAHKLNASQAERLTELQFEQIRADEMSQKISVAAGELLDTMRRMAPPKISVNKRIYKGVLLQLRHVELQIKETVQGPITIDLDPTSGAPRCFMGDSVQASPIGNIARIEDKQSDPLIILGEYIKRVGGDSNENRAA